MDKENKDKLRRNLTKGELLDMMKRIQEEERAGQRAVGLAMICVMATLFLSIWLLTSCSTPEPSHEDMDWHELDMEEKRFYVEGTNMEGYYSSVKYNDPEVWHLNLTLGHYGIEAFRVDENDLEHQRRYQRHFINPR